MNKKQLEKKVKNSIKLESKEFLNELLEYSLPKKNKFNIKSIFQILVLPLILIIVLISKNVWDNSRIGFTGSQQDEIYFNEIEYDVSISENSLGVDSLKIYPHTENLDYIKHLLNIDLTKTLTNNNVDVKCQSFIDSGKLFNCNINILDINGDDLKLQIGIQKNELPRFVDEDEDKWTKQVSVDKLNESIINKTTVVLIKNTKSEFNNFRTKFMKNDVGIAINSYNIDENEFIDILKAVINS